MADRNPNPAEHGNGSNHYTGSLTLGDGSRTGITRLRDQFALHIEFGTATDTVFMDRDEVRALALRLIDATQIDREED
jgi:hypothetical protein